MLLAFARHPHACRVLGGEVAVDAEDEPIVGRSEPMLKCRAELFDAVLEDGGVSPVASLGAGVAGVAASSRVHDGGPLAPKLFARSSIVSPNSMNWLAEQ